MNENDIVTIMLGAYLCVDKVAAAVIAWKSAKGSVATADTPGEPK